MCFSMVFKQLRQNKWSQCWNNTHSETTCHCTLSVLDQFLDFSSFGQNYFCLFYNLFAYIGSSNGMFVSIKKSHIQFFLQLMNLHAQGRLCYKTFFGRCNKTFVTQ